jgi:hypothetical protein
MSKEALKLALEALEICEQDGYIPVRLTRDSITAIKQALAAPDLQAELDATNKQVEILSDALAESRRQRPWVGLTDEQKHEFRYSHMTTADFIVAIEAKLKELNT